MDNEPKISLPEAYLLIAFALIADLINWIPIVNWLVTAVTLPGFQLYFRMKGVKGIWGLAGNLVELIPFLSVLPGITAGVVATIIIDRLAASKLGATALKAAGPAGKIPVSRLPLPSESKTPFREPLPSESKTPLSEPLPSDN